MEIYGEQSPERIAVTKRQIDAVIRLKSAAALAAFACDGRNSPEAPYLSKLKALESVEQRQRQTFDVAYLEAATIGIERCTTRLGRLIGFRQAGWWPAAWLPLRREERAALREQPLPRPKRRC